MKQTFLIGFPRCGSKALSMMMNNKNCIAWHEGNDYEIPLYTSYKDSYCYQMELKAEKEGKSFFCCDITAGKQLMKLRRKYLIDHNIEDKTQFIYIAQNDDRVMNGTIKILNMLSEINKMEPTDRLVSEVFNGMVEHMADWTDLIHEYKYLKRVTVIRKEGKTFSDVDISIIAQTCRAVFDECSPLRRHIDISTIYNKSSAYYSMTPIELYDGHIKLRNAIDAKHIEECIHTTDTDLLLIKKVSNMISVDDYL